MITAKEISAYRPQGQFGLDSAKRALDILSEILLHSRKGIRVDNYLEDASKAKKFNPRLFAETAKQSRYFGFLNGRLTPKKVYSEIVEDELSTYENRFAKLCLDLIAKEAALAYRSFRQNASLTNAIGPFRFSKWGNADQAKSFLSDFASLSEKMGAIRRLHEMAGLLSSTAFYSSVKALSEDGVHPNNALNYDPLYGSLYKLYLQTSYAQDEDLALKRLLTDFQANAKCVSLSLPGIFVDGDFEFKLRRYKGQLELRVTNLVDGANEKYGLDMQTGFVGTSLSLASSVSKVELSLFQSADYSAPIRMLGLSLMDAGFCPLCGERLSGDKTCPACHTHYRPYIKEGATYLWAPDLLFSLGGRSDA